MNNFVLYKQTKGRNINVNFVYDQYVNLGDNKYAPSQLRAIISGLPDRYKENERVGYKDFFIGRDDWALNNNVDSSEADDELKNAEKLFNSNKNIVDLRQNKTISYLLDQIDLFLEKMPTI